MLEIQKMNRYISMLRSSRSALILAIQKHKQLEAIYQEHHADTILSNCMTHLVLPGAGQHECEYYSRRAGMQTVIAHGFSRTEAQYNSYAYSQSQAQRPLIMPDEIRTMSRGYLLMISGNAQPMIVQNTPYFRHPWLASRVDLPYARPARRMEAPLPAPRLLRSSRPMPSVRITEIAEPYREPSPRLLPGPQAGRQQTTSDGTRWDPDHDNFPPDW
jgi:type IV secretory pathway TraG/TraD family ATPase VirD4